MSRAVASDGHDSHDPHDPHDPHDSQRVKVFVRVRPCLDDGTQACVSVVDGGAPGMDCCAPACQDSTVTRRLLLTLLLLLASGRYPA